MERPVIFECVIGSHLYGTNTAESDLDYVGIFVPTETDLLGVRPYPDELSFSEKKSIGSRNMVGDIDRKLFSLAKFLQLAGKGQPTQLEMLCAPKEKWQLSSAAWITILENRDLFLSKKSVAPFLGFARAQAHRSVMKGENLRRLREMISVFSVQRGTLGIFEQLEIIKDPKLTEDGQGILCNLPCKLVLNEKGITLIEIVGRKYDLNIRFKVLCESLSNVIDSYGTRSHAAAEQVYDTKSLLHAVRQIGEAEEYLTTGFITLPRPTQERDLLMKIRRGEWPPDDFDVFEYMDNRINEIQRIVNTSNLPEESNWNKINELCIILHKEALSSVPHLDLTKDDE